MVDITLIFLLLTTALNGVTAGASLDQAIKQLPTRHRIGVVLYSTYSKNADLGNGLPWYISIGISAVVVTLGAAVAAIAVVATAPAAVAAAAAAVVAPAALAATATAARSDGDSLRRCIISGDTSTIGGRCCTKLGSRRPRGVHRHI